MRPWPFGVSNAGTDQMKALTGDYEQYGLTSEDCEKYKADLARMNMGSAIGSIAGTVIGFYTTFRLRGGQNALLSALRIRERPIHLIFVDGRTAPLPDLWPFMKSSFLRDLTGCSLASLGGYLAGESLGRFGGFVLSAHNADYEYSVRLRNAVAKYKARILREEADKLDKLVFKPASARDETP